MKRKFILLAMMLLTLIGGVKFNVLNAQEDVVVINEVPDTYGASYPFVINNYYQLSQHIVPSTKINHDGGVIDKIAFKVKSGLTKNFTLYLQNTDLNSLSSWVAYTDADKVYSNESLDLSNVDTDYWLILDIDNFDYEGGNLLIIASDNTNKYGNETGTGTGLIYNTGGDYCTLYNNGTSPITTSSSAYQSARQLTVKLFFAEPADDIVPAAPTNLAVAERTHNSVSLTWVAAENAKKYNVHVYNNGVEITGSPFTSTKTAYTVEGLDAETTYTFKVQSVRGDNLSENFSNEVSATTLEAPKTRNIVFVLTDSYGDGWNGNTLQVYLNDVLTHTLSNENLDGSYKQEEEQTKILSIIEGTEVKVVYNYPGGNTYTNENSFEIYYEDGTLINGQDKITGNGTTSTFVVVTFTVELSVPKVTIEASEESIYLDETATLTATAANFEGDVTYSWSPVENLSDAAISNPVFTPTTTGIFEFTCTATDAQNNEASETITINVTERPALSLTVNANKTQIYAGHYATLQALVIGGFDPYTYSWSLGGQVVETADTYSFSASEPGEYTITCKVTDDKGEEVEKSETITVIPDPFVGKQFRIKVVNGTYANYYLNINTNKAPGTYDYSSWNYITESQVGVAVESDYDGQKFTIENDGDGHYYLKSADGYYIKCDYRNQTYNGNWWSVYAYSNSEKTPLVFEYVGENFYIRDYDKMTNNSVSGGDDTYTPNNSYFKVNSNSLVYCDAAISVPEVVLWTVEEILPKPENLVATPAQIYAGDVTTLTWNEFDGAASYNVYVNSELNGSTTGTSYELSGLAYNMNPGHKIEVVALNENGDVISGKASVIVQVAGTFTLTVNVTDDGTNPIIGATVNIDMAYAYDELKNQISPVTVEPTGADGKTTVELPILCQERTYVYTSYYTVEVSKSPYQDNNGNYINYNDDVTSGYTLNVVLDLPMVDYIQVQDEEGNDLYGYVMEGTNVVLSWDELEGATAYNVYKLLAGEVESSETVEETTYTIESIEKGYQYAVSALFGELESAKNYANIDVKGNGYFKGYVTDDTNALEGIQVKVSSEYGASAVAITDAEGYFNGEIVEGDNYILTISHSDYEEFTSETFAIGYEAEYDFETITLTAKPSASDITGVTATLNDENVDVEWTVNETSTYTKYNVYRRLAGTQGKGDNIAQNVEATSTTDDAWETLEPGTYQYGVAAFVEGGTEMGVQLSENFDDGVMPEGWINTNLVSPADLWVVNQGRLYSQWTGNYYLTISQVISTSGATMTFKYMNPQYNATSRSEIHVYYSTSLDGELNEIATYSYTSAYNLQETSIDLSVISEEEIYITIANINTGEGGNGAYIDDLVITGEVTSEVETQIVWSNGVVKQGPNTFEGTVSTDWNVAENWSHGNAPEAGDEVIVNAEAVISGNVELSTLDIVGNGSVTVDANASLTVTGAITQEKYYSLIMNDGAQVFQNNANVTAQFNMNLVNPSDWSTSNKDGWQFISSPLSNVNVTNIAEGNYDLYKYDGEKEYEWVNHKDVNFADDTYQHHIGYLASHETMSTLEFKGTLNYNDGDYGSYSFYDCVEYYENEPLKNFYLIGNPYPFNISWADFKNNKGMVNGYAYVKEDGNYWYATSGEIAVGDGFFVQAISGTPDDPYSTFYYYLKGSGNTKSTRGSNNSLNITATGNAGEDNVIINLAGKSEGFDKLQNFNDAIATVYVAEGGKNYGIYNCDADVQEVELSFNANKMGNYTISIEPNGKFQIVTLVDRFTGVETNMLVEDYNFTAMSSDNHNRFIVRFANGQQTTDNSHFVYQSGEELILNIQGEVQIVDVLGRVVYNGEAMNDINRINVSSFNSGAYMVKVMNGNEVKVEKVVIY